MSKLAQRRGKSGKSQEGSDAESEVQVAIEMLFPYYVDG